ncbi:fatty acyl-CoA desaturase, putative [Eimeria mitis]|uniref:Fatty acyl-CoA desaturase, putative n=1 Tax=Eimeria mitis TaxID=44415 RepID=U6K163_9EIME|nr:fatty acyl-CoA desaturase, putative [Eimeria mitis]CDJ29508.1 fatty acyl-CoA desaturase, putative [Eimeria mitis]
MLETLWQQMLPVFTEEFWAEPLRAPMISRSCRHLMWSSPRLFSTFAFPSSKYPPLTRLVVCIFCLGKGVEVFDTFLLFLRGRRPSFLHCYARVAVALYCWHALYADVPFAHGFVAANLAVQVFVHAYFAAAEFAVTKRLFTFLRSYITLLQLSQMFFGMLISSHAIYHPQVQQSALAVFNAKLCLAMYISHAILFLQFYLDAFCKEYRSGEATFLTFFHAFAVIGIVKLVLHEQCWRLLADTLLLYVVGGLGITCGAHRLWSHRAYKASAGLRCFLMLLTSLANQGSVFHWARDHRVHHKNSDKEGDPYNASRGFFYSHVGWLLLKKPQSVKDAGKQLNFDDLLADPFVRFQHKLDPWWNQFWCFVVPSIYAYYKYNDFWTGFFVLGCLRWCICLHATWTVNSTAHIWGDRRYTVEGNPCESCFTALVAVGEGWHDWHHKYPYDYAASEGGIFDQYNPSKLFIDICAWLGLAWERRRATATWKMLKAEREQQALVRQQRDAEALQYSKVPLPGLLCCCPQWSLVLDVCLLACAYVLTWWCYSACTSRLNTAPQALMEASPYVLLPLLLIVSSAVLGSLFFSLLMHAFVAANGTFSRSSLLSDFVGGLICGLLMIPYQRKRFNVPGETPALRPFLYTATLAAPRLPGWSACLAPLFLTLAVGFTLMLSLWRGHVLLVSTFYLLPHLVMDTWTAYYFLTMEKKGPPFISFRFVQLLCFAEDDVMNNNCKVPLHRVPEAVSYVKERVESMPAEVFSASLSDGFAVVHPDSRPEYYNSLGQPTQTRRAEESGTSANGEVDKKAKDLDEMPFAASSSTLTKRTRAVGS